MPNSYQFLAMRRDPVTTFRRNASSGKRDLRPRPGLVGAASATLQDTPALGAVGDAMYHVLQEAIAASVRG
jgi:hypothetical protein